MEVKREDILETMWSMVDIIGIDKFLDVSKVYGGYNGQELANDYGVGIWHIYRIVKKNANDESDE